MCDKVTANINDGLDSYENHPNSSSSSNSSIAPSLFTPAQLTVIGGSSNNWALENDCGAGRRDENGNDERTAFMNSTTTTTTSAATNTTSRPSSSSSSPSSSSSSSSSVDASLGANVVPALGNSWHHCVSTRLVLEQLSAHQRMLTIAKSPIAAQVACGFVVASSGLIEVRKEGTGGEGEARAAREGGGAGAEVGLA